MKLVSRNICAKGAEGSVTLIPEEAEDMWHAYNLISVNDRVRASAVRRVQSESNTGSIDSQRVKTTLTIQVESVEFDTAACALRLNGRNVEENEYVKMGAYHTLDLEQNRKFTIMKNEWDSVALERIDQACNPRNHADLGAIVMQEGLAHVCLVTPSMTIVRSRIESNIPRKRKGSMDQHDKGMRNFFDQIYRAVLQHFDFNIIRCVLVASPGFVKDQFREYLFSEALKREDKVLVENQKKFMFVHSSSGHKGALQEVLADPAVTSKQVDTMAAGEVRSLERFYQMLNSQPDRAYYGYNHVAKAAENGAVEVLMITDELFRATEVGTRQKYVRLVDSVKENSGEVRIFSSLHVSGEQLKQLSGVAAILRFPMPDIDTEDEDVEDVADEPS
eukprot:Colp12_sorted_trinity150504_noHs@16312